MLFTTVLTFGLAGIAAAIPNLAARDKFVPCSTMGSNCAVQNQEFCDPDTSKISVCHKFGSDCWIRYTQDPCAAKRSLEAAEMQKRDKFDKCSVFGANCAVDGNEFCDADTGKISVCHKVPFSSECWVRYTQTACAAKREAQPEVETVEKRDKFDKCSVFGSNCAVDGNEFCYQGIKSVCHKVPFTNDCWVRFTAASC